MELKYSKLSKNPSASEIKSEIERLESLGHEYKNEEMAIKILINSFYGALANKYFISFNPDVAESVTLQGQDLIKTAEKFINKYFLEFWHKDEELHNKLGIKNKVRKISKPMVIYCDTDSNYVSFEEIIDSCNYPGDPKELILDINKYRLSGYLKKCFDIYASKWGTDNYQDFELESISYSGIWLGKKKYVQDLMWIEGIDIPSLTNIKPTGIEIIQASSSPFSRDKLTILLKHIFDKKDKLNLPELVNILKDIKDEFILQEPSNISNSKRVNNLEKWIICDIKDKNFEYAKGTPIHVRGSGHHNWLLNNNEKWKEKYELIKSGDKIKYYYVKTKTDKEQNIFSFPIGNYPYEFAPPIDFEEQFRITIIDPLNRIIESMGFPPLSPNLYVESPIF